MKWRIDRREHPSRRWQYLSPVLALVLTLVTGALLFWISGKNPTQVLYAYFIFPISDGYGISELLLKATPLILISLGLALGFQAGVWNIGAEGQFLLGAIFASYMPLFVANSAWNPWILLPSMLILAAVGGMLWAAIPAWLRIRFNVNEILSSLMLNYVAVLLLLHLVHSPWRDPHGRNFPQTALFEDNALLPLLVDGFRVNIGFFFALVMTLVLWYLMRSSFFGYQIRVFGFSPAAALYSGIHKRYIIWTALLLTGALAGIAGFHEVAGPVGQLTPGVVSHYGYTAIIIAYLGRLHPLGIVFAALLLALSFIGSESAQISEGIPLAFNGVFQGLLLFFIISCDFLIHFRIGRSAT